MYASTRPPVVNERKLIPMGLYQTFTVGYYMGGPPRVPLATQPPEIAGDETAGGHYARPACSCKILGRKNCPVHMGQGCAEPTSVTPGEGSYQGGDLPTGGPIAAEFPTGLVVGLGGAALVGGLFAAGIL